MTNDYEQVKNIIEQVVEENLQKIHMLQTATFLDQNAYYETFDEVSEAFKSIPPVDEHFMHYILEQHPDLYACMLQMSSILLAIENAAKYI
ncbi:hypothetical protein [Pseudescherichia vulneris]|uniref:hypothetical protein n=1 Tax=Pseudescherichia vulneris TaxID=566 RepID=UPI001EDDED1B|nr:hypothetical protein [Pseudescherichia vulneris]